jgi:hypothetical protein
VKPPNREKVNWTLTDKKTVARKSVWNLVTLAQQRGEAQLLNKARIRVTLAVNGLLKARQTRKSKAQLVPGPLLRSEEIWSISRRQ